VDDHLVEPPDMFEGRLPKRFEKDAPRVLTLEPGKPIPRTGSTLPPLVPGDNRQAWEYEGELFVHVGLNAVAGHTDFAALRTEPSSFSEMRPGCYDIHARVRDMDINGVWASVNFPSLISGFSGTVFSRSKDQDLGHAVMRAWNDWLFDEWYGPYPERIVPLGITWLADPELGAAEIRRNAGRGFTAVTIPEMPHRLGFPSLQGGYWDPLLRACEETDTALCLHVGSSGMIPLSESSSRYEQNITFFPAMSMIAGIEWLWSGVAVEFPRLKFVLAEGGIGWVPMVLDRLDYIASHALRGGTEAWPGSKITPAEVLQRNFYFCMLDDPSTLPAVHRIGIDHVMLETDYPHSDGTWPDSQALIHQRFQEAGDALSVEDIRKITHLNAARLFRHPLPPVCVP
jgi:predicted TIM-barrel fold metal-dependent hydrolase